MGLGNFLGGLGTAYQGFRQGEQDRVNRDKAEQDRAFQLQQRDVLTQQQGFQQGQQQRTLDAQGRADQLREDAGKIPAPGETLPAPELEPGADPSTAQPKVQTQEQQLRDLSKMFRTHDIGKAMDLAAKADQLAMQRSANSFLQLSANAPGKSAAELATMAKDVFDNDPLPGKIARIDDLGADGVAITFHDPATGQSSRRQFKTPQEVMSALQARYSPASAAALAQANAKARAEAGLAVVKENAKGVVVPAGSTFVPSATDPKREQFTNNNGLIATGRFNEDGSPEMVRVSGRGGAGGAGGSGKAPKTRLDTAVEMFDVANTKGETKFTTPEQYNVGRDHLTRLLHDNPSLAPETAVRVATRIAANPDVVQPALNRRTGRIDNMVQDDLSGDTLSIRANVGSAKSLPKGMDPKDAAAQTGDMLGWLDQQVPGSRELFVKAAFDKSGSARAELDAKMKAQVIAAMGQVPGFAQLPLERQQAAIDKAVAASNEVTKNRLDMIQTFVTPPKPVKAPEAPRKPIRRTGGLAPVGSDQARHDLRQAELRAGIDAKTKANAERDQQLSTQFRADKAAMDPLEFARKYDALRTSLSTSDAAELRAVESTLR